MSEIDKFVDEWLDIVLLASMVIGSSCDFVEFDILFSTSSTLSVKIIIDKVENN